MKSRAAVLYGTNQPFQVEEIEVEEPRDTEILVKIAATGLCHSDWHVVTGDIPVEFPYICGHEGAGVVEKVGSKVTRVQPGDHVVLSFIPSCGVCRWCTNGMTNLCDLGATILAGTRPDGSFRMKTKDGKNAGQICAISTFSEWTVCDESSIVKVEQDYPFDVAALVGCGVATGFGAAKNRARVTPGSTVVVIGIGGIGINAVQGAAALGAAKIIAVDKVDFKLEQAKRFGATHTINADREDVVARVQELTDGVGADFTFEAIGNPITVGQAVSCASKGGTAVAIGVSPWNTETIPVNPFELVLFQKALLGTLYGSSNPRTEIPNLLNLYRAGKLKLDELITKRYTLDQINEGYKDMIEGRNIRGVIEFK